MEAECEMQIWTRFCENYFLGKGFAKPRLILFEIRRDFGFRPRAGGVWGGMRAGFFSDFLATEFTHKMTKIKKGVYYKYSFGVGCKSQSVV
jgi:hypothetical protein